MKYSTPDFGTRPQLHPVEQYVPLAFKLLVYGILLLFLYEAADAFYEYKPGQSWPFLLGTFRMFTFLPIHEAGHLMFRIFGTTVMFLGGSFLQIMLPLLWFIVAFKQRSHVAPFGLFWAGENMMDVSLYMRDAPVRLLPLLGGDKAGHDWHNIFSRWDILDSSGTIADIFYFGGLITAVGAIAAGLYLAFAVFFSPPSFTPVPGAESSKSGCTKIENLLDDKLEPK